jgi:hypothetical protein
MKIAKAILDSDYDFDTMIRSIPDGVIGNQVMAEAQKLDNELFDGQIYWAQSNINAGGESK